MTAIDHPRPLPSRVSTLAAVVARLDGLAARMSPSLVSLGLRFALAFPFFRSGLTKWDAPLVLSGSAKFLFHDEFRLHLLGFEVPYPFPDAMAFASGSAEIVLPILLVLGLATRFAALGILAMTAVIQLTVPDGWEAYHLPWAAMAGALTIIGPGRVALDALVARLLAHRSR